MPSEAAPQEIAVVIPCLNEAATIGDVVREFSKALPESTVYVFDNNSTDDTAEVARAAGATVVRSPRQGKGNVLRHMSRVVEADVYVLVDGDGTYPAEAAPAMLERFRRDHLDMLVGTRLEDFEKGAFRVFHLHGNRLVSRLIGALFRTHLTDVLSGYRILSRAFVRVVRLRRDGFEAETEMTLQALTKHLAIGEMPVRYSARARDSSSKLSTWSDGWLILKCLGLLVKDYRPMVFFGAMSGLLLLACLVVGSAPIQDYVEHRYVYHVPRAILASGLGVLSVIALTAGLILDTVVRLHEETIEFWKQEVDGRK